MNIKTKLVIRFQASNEKIVSITIDDPKDELNEQDIKTTMNLIVEKNIFSINGSDLIKALDAKVVETNTTEFGLSL